MDAFGPNEWLVDEIYQQYLKDPHSVDKAWWEFFADYRPADISLPDGAAVQQPEPAQPQTEPPAQRPKATEAAGPAAREQAVPAQSSPPPPPQPSPQAAPARPAQAPAAQPSPAEQTSTAPTVGPAQPSADGMAPQVPATAPPVPPKPSEPKPEEPDEDVVEPLRGAGARVVTNMETSLEVPTATSVRAVPAKLLIDNRIVINNHLKRSRGGKVSFTHLIGFALVQALKAMPEMNWSYTEIGGEKPAIRKPRHVNLGLAIDLQKRDGTRQLVVPSIKAAEEMDFARFWAAYEDIVRRARSGKLTLEDFAGTTISLTNPGGIGTVHSVPRLMAGQSAIIGVGAMEYPAEFQGAAPDTLARLAVSKIMTLTSTYDHRIIQGAQSGEFLGTVHQLLLGENGFYDDVFEALRIPYEPVRWVQDISASHKDDVDKTARVLELIHSYRVRGHLMADTDPLEYRQRRHPDLDVVQHGLTLWDLEREFATGGFGGKPIMTLREILGVLRDSYCRTIGIEYMHIQDPRQRRWIQQRVEIPYAHPTREEQLRILRRLNAAEAFETFLQIKYVGQKRFSLEGGESLIPLLDAVLSDAADADLDEVCIGMAHRGRLNVLANIAGKSYAQIFREFEGNQDPRTVQGSGDVKYHLGTTGEFTAESGAATKVSIAANPSHLEAVNPVVEGVVRAKQDRLNKGGGHEGFTVLPLVVHGDAAFAGQGVVAETLNLSQLRGYRTGGTVHVVINNQVGFTTSPAEGRSSLYATDVARMIEAPIFHVNGDDPEAVVRVARLAFEFRQAFKKDVVIDLLCYRRRGHNEGDDPSMTQPMMYDLIDKKRSVRKLYTEGLIGRGDISVEEAEDALRDYQEQLERVFVETRESSPPEPAVAVEPEPPAGSGSVQTAVKPEVVKKIGDAQVTIPEGFTVHPKLQPLMTRRAAMASQGGIDWAFAELIAFGSLLLDGVPVRLAGQDSQRGTFVQRHSVLVDRTTGQEWTPLAHLDPGQARFWVYDSLLSEFAAMGFEYGYSVERPDALVLWEAQFGDFGNGAQAVIDEFVASGEQKWGQHSSLVLLLPHGYEGQGPDHSSGRVERFLSLCAQNNMTVAMPSVPSNYFHLLRWQALNGKQRPLIVLTPKSMLRLKAATSGVEEFTAGTFRPVIGDASVDPAGVRKVLLCSGKISYELEMARSRLGLTDTAIVRVERLYPLPSDEMAAALAAYPAGAALRWVQEEPLNQGSWPFMALNLPEHLGGRPLYRVTRPASSAPACGSHAQHEREQAQLIDQALGGP